MPWAVVFFTIGAYKLLANLGMAIARPPALRASSDGVWLGGGPTIPWQDIDVVYPGDDRNGRRLPSVTLSFHRKRTLFRIPARLWLTTAPLGDVAIPVHGIYIGTRTLIAQLDALRASGDRTLPGAHVELPAARVVDRG